MLDLPMLEQLFAELQFGWPWVVWLLPLPVLFWLLPKARPLQPQAVPVPFYAALSSGQTGQARRRSAYVAWLVLVWLMLLAAASRPQFVGDIEELPISGRDLMLAVDISGSMDTADMAAGVGRITRLNAVKVIVGDFIQRRAGDRTGLVLFGTQAYLQVPLTFDLETTAAVLNDAEIGLAGKQTAIGDAIGLAVKRLRENPNEQQVLILLTDGANTGGALEPLQAAEFARQAGLKIYTIGIGADRMQVRDFFGTRNVNPSADLDEESLTAIAEMTGGRYFRARDPAQLNQIYRILDELEPVATASEAIRPVTELYHWPLGGALLITLLLAAWAALAGRVGRLFRLGRERTA